MAAFAGPLEVGFSGNGPANIARGEFVSGDYFSTVGAKTILGRPLGLADDAPTASPVIVLDYGYWQRAFGADPSAVGRTVRLNNVDVAIVGVAEPGFTSLTPGKSQDFFMPLSLAKRVRGEWWGTAGPVVRSGKLVGRAGWPAQDRAFPSSRHRLRQRHSSTRRCCTSPSRSSARATRPLCGSCRRERL